MRPDLKLLAIKRLVATGNTIKDEIKSTPTILIEIATVNATNIEKNKLINLLGTPAKYALSSSKDI